MFKLLKKVFAVSAFLGVFLLVKPVCAAVPSGSVQNYEIATTTGSGNFVNISASNGYVYDVILSSGAAGDYVVCFDSASITGLAVGANGTLTAPRLPITYAVQSGTITAVTAHWQYTAGIGLANGLSCAQSGTQHVNILWRPNQ